MSKNKFHIIDRRKNQSGKSDSIRQRFLNRNKLAVRAAVKNAITTRKIKDSVTDGATVRIKEIDTKEWSFYNDRHTGVWKGVNPGNRKFHTGDLVLKPPGAPGSNGSQASPDGEGEDDFVFNVTKEELEEFFFDELQLPDLVKKNIKNVEEFQKQRAGFSTQGVPCNLDLVRSMKNSIGRELSFDNDNDDLIYALQQQLESLINQFEKSEQQIEMIGALKKQIAELVDNADVSPSLDKMDLQYRTHTMIPVPNTRAVMFCVDGDTEYLSPSGWKKISSYTCDGSPDVAQYTAVGNIEFVTPNQYVKTMYNDEYIDLSGQGINQRLTKNHRFIYKDKQGNIKECLSQDVHLLKSWHNKNTVITTFDYSGSGLSLTDDEIRLDIAFKADGTYQQENTNRAQFCFIKQRKVERMIQLLERIGLTYNISRIDDRTWIYTTTSYRIEKHYSSEWYKATKSQLCVIGEEVLYWDGCVDQNSFYAKDKNDVDYIQFVWAACDLGTHVYENGPVWTVRYCHTNTRSLTNKTKIFNVPNHNVSYTHAYCFSVDSGMLLLRRNDEIFVSGNCIMDVSGSMGEHEKTLAKYFFILLFLFLSRSYKKVDIRFIRHHSIAKEVDEEEFFHSKESGGTVVSGALTLMNDIIKKDYNDGTWNIYGAQASDGDNWGDDNHELTQLMVNSIMPVVQYFAYIEVLNANDPWRSSGTTDVWKTYEPIKKLFGNLDLATVNHTSQIFPVFAELFSKTRQRRKQS